MRSEKRSSARAGYNPRCRKGPTFLERKSVTESREVSYRSAWQTFVESYPKRKVKVMSLKCLDECATMHVNQMFWEGHNIADVRAFMAAVKFMRSDVRTLSDLPRTTKAARGFAKLAPVQGRVPLPFPCLAKIAEFLVMQGQPMDRSTLHGMVGASVGEMPQEEKSARTSVRVHHGQGCGLVQTRRGGPELPASRDCLHVSDPPRVSQFRPDVRLSNLARHHETRKVEVSPKHFLVCAEMPRSTVSSRNFFGFRPFVKGFAGSTWSRRHCGRNRFSSWATVRSHQTIPTEICYQLAKKASCNHGLVRDSLYNLVSCS